MKIITCLFLMIFATANIYSQTYTISFAATGAATTVDSVKVENLTHTATVKWHAGDILHLVLSNGIKDFDVNDETIKVYPNPMQWQAEISFYAKKAGNATLSIYDIAGKKVLQTEGYLTQGTHKYQLSGLKQGMYFVNINGDSYFYTAKLINQNATQSEAKIKYIGIEKSEATINILKSTKATISMAYTTGDSIRFTGYAAGLNAIVNDVPTGSKTISFAFVATNCPATVNDIDGNTYNTVLIGSQCWMRENLKTSKYNNNTNIPNVTNDTEWLFLTTGACCYYNNDTSNNTVYGKLYNWSAVNTGSLCPTGWHVPSDAELTTLTAYLGGEEVAGGKLKETGFTHWISPNIGATNETGFSGLPGGYRDYYYGSFLKICNFAYWWSSTATNSSHSWNRLLLYNDVKIYMGYSDKKNGLSVRCLKDI